jgi:hypothetical protein
MRKAGKRINYLGVGIYLWMTSGIKAECMLAEITEPQIKKM